MTRTLGLIALAAFAVSGCSEQKTGSAAPSSPVASVAAPAGKSWSDMVVETPEGGYRMGNPNAPVKLIEYASFTCPHCKLFESEGAPKLIDKYVKTGRVSWEFRSLLIHAPDAPLALLMSCRGADTYFPLSEQLFAVQEEILNKVMAMTPAEQQALQNAQPADQFRALAEKGGMFGFFGARGLSRTQAAACLSDQKRIEALTANQQHAADAGVNSTPSFLINGELQQNAATWGTLDPLLQQAVGG
ncbi:thioredoxin domain-containing protein [uncultured Sphingomonas sp.]|uniref:thioredoxin domain-containing protein n=1 Tax=uncultured Sphingomonas sp. TaxID=158754 RepID=UPI0025F05D1A|nr:thioredoxin domain-containing protein [uncultured Sphingomonas sp.]